MTKLTDINFDASPNFSTRGPNKPQIIVLHCPVSDFKSCINTFKSSLSKVSAHYVIDRDGSIAQMVKLEDAAWHAMHYPNMIGIGIEHVDRYPIGNQLSRGCMQDPSWFTTAELQASAELVAQLMKEFNIPLTKVMGHNDPWLRQFGNNHTDPGTYFPWIQYRQLVQKQFDLLNVSEGTMIAMMGTHLAVTPVSDPEPTVQEVIADTTAKIKKPRYKGGRRLIKK